ncbi:hypothetical protein [uncultured Corynebacterium sp.]|uniref:hypothetical protein n=1 Tax=uncultured Corynebacterium sp. TaxID=159447 RepID=UPI002597CC6F|nr:hypothetical protein [uncultured Corynebacterium sp.]
MKEESKDFSHADVEFLVRERGLNVTGDLLAAISDLSDALEGEYASTNEALEALSKFATRAINKVPLSLAVIESRLKAVESAVGIEGSDQ